MNYLSVDCESSSDSDTREERGYKRTLKGRFKLANPEKTYESKEDGKRKKLNLDRYVEEFKEVFSIGKEKIKYYGLEKCKIVIEKGKKVFKNGQMVPQALIRDTEKHLEDLQKREVIRESNSSWRNPIRSLRKPDGGIRLVSNLIALNDIEEKDDYKLTNIRDVVRATQGAEYMTVVDLKEGFYSIEIEEEDKYTTRLSLMEKFTNGTQWQWDLKIHRRYYRK